MREPTIAWWPGRIKPGKTTEVWKAVCGIRTISVFCYIPLLSPSLSPSLQLAATIDLLPTIANLTRASIPNNVTIDGIDMSPFLFGTGNVNR